jgi:hypothetical protein
MYLSAAQVEIDSLIGDHSWKGFCDAPHLDIESYWQGNSFLQTAIGSVGSYL